MYFDHFERQYCCTIAWLWTSSGKDYSSSNVTSSSNITIKATLIRHSTWRWRTPLYCAFISNSARARKWKWTVLSDAGKHHSRRQHYKSPTECWLTYLPLHHWHNVINLLCLHCTWVWGSLVPELLLCDIIILCTYTGTSGSYMQPARLTRAHGCVICLTRISVHSALQLGSSHYPAQCSMIFGIEITNHQLAEYM